MLQRLELYMWWSSGTEGSRIGLWELQKRNAETLVLMRRLAGLFYPPGDDDECRTFWRVLEERRGRE